jgi:hypothetical protein
MREVEESRQRRKEGRKEELEETKERTEKSYRHAKKEYLENVCDEIMEFHEQDVNI